MVDHITYVGPYVVAKSRPVKKSKDMETCTNTSCERHGTHLGCAYCPVCGTKVEMGKVEFDGYSAEPFELHEVVDQKMYYQTGEKGTDYWFSNLTTMDERAGRSFNVGEEEQYFPVTPKMMKEEIKAFMELHADEIEKLRQAYDKVEILWGVLAYWR